MVCDLIDANLYGEIEGIWQLHRVLHVEGLYPSSAAALKSTCYISETKSMIVPGIDTPKWKGAQQWATPQILYHRRLCFSLP